MNAVQPSLSRALFAAVVAAAALAIWPALASAASLVDDTTADFAAGPGGPGTWVTEPGSVRLRPTGLSEGFDDAGPGLPASLTADPWTPPAGSAIVGSGALTVDGMRVHPGATHDGPEVLEFRATFADSPFQHVGFGQTFENPPWAMFSTGGGSLPTGLFARTLTPTGTAINDPIAVDPLVPHTYRIEWTPTEVRYFVDGAGVATHALEIATQMRFVASDFAEGPGNVMLDWVGTGALPASGVFESRVHDAGDERAVWDGLTATASGGGAIELETRTGDTATPDATWSAWQPTGTGGAIANPIARHIQYRATLSGGAPSLDRVEIGYEIDVDAPVAVIDGVDVTGGTASVRFSSAAVDVDRFECRLDAPGTVFESCTSPHVLSGLATGSHTVLVRAVDEAGNEGPEAQQSFAVDADAPVAVVDGVDVAGGTASVRFSSAAVDVDRFECRLDAPGTVFAACVSPHVLSGLATGSHTVLVRAVDQAGNVGPEAQGQFTIAAPPGSGGGPGDTTQPPPSQGDPDPEPVVDTTAPRVAVLTRSARASRTGIVAVRVSCPAGETRCRVAVRLKQGRNSSKRKTVTVLGGKGARARVRLPKATRTLLAARGRLRVTALVTARDDAGNVKTTTHRLTLRAPAV